MTTTIEPVSDAPEEERRSVPRQTNGSHRAAALAGSDGTNGGARYNLAARVFDHDHYSEVDALDQLEPTDGDRYNLAERVYGTATVTLARPSAAPARPEAAAASGNGAPPAAAVAAPFEEAAPRRRWGLPRTFDALKFSPFRWYMGAMIWWNGAMSMQMLVRGYLAYHLTGDFRALGIVGLGSGVPMLLLSPVGGVIADRTSRRLVLQVGQGFSLIIAVIVAMLLFSGVLEFWHLVAASVAQGVMMALVMPSRQSFLPEVVGMQRLMNAIPLQTAGMNLMQLMAPAIGGFMIDWIGAGSVYSVMAVMYAMSVVMLFGVRSMSSEDLEATRAEMNSQRSPSAASRVVRGDRRRGGTLSELTAGLAYIFRDRTILAIMSLSFLTSILGMPIRMLLPGYASAVFGDSGATLGLLQSSMAVGALGGALGLATLTMRRHRGALLAGSAVLMGVAMVAFSTTGIFVLGAVGLFAVGIGSAGRQAMSQILVQEYVEDDYRGRVMSVFMMQFSLMSVGTLFVGIYMEAVGPQFAIGSLGAALIASTLIYLTLVPRLRKLD